MKKQGIYIHIPYCGSKCLYCDFFSGGARSADWKLLRNSLLNELKERLGEIDTEASLSTLYIGGGTPSLMPAEDFTSLVNGIGHITEHRGGWDEFTIEVNPEDVTPDICEVWKSCGVNRISMGVQSFSDEELKTIGRRHTVGKAISSFNLLRRYFDNISIDLMFGLPGQDIVSWNESIREALKLHPEHISAYSLMFEEGTAMTVLRNQGRLVFPEEEECVAMWNILSCELKKRGYHQYEISNYSIPGYESVHNRRYWLGYPYLGIGPSAHSYDGERIRRSNPPRLREYLDHYGSDTDSIRPKGLNPFQEVEMLNEEELIEEFIMLRMRMSEGIWLNEFRSRFGEKNLERLLHNSIRCRESGNVVLDDDRLRLSPCGIMRSDEIIVSLMI